MRENLVEKIVLYNLSFNYETQQAFDSHHNSFNDELMMN